MKTRMLHLSLFVVLLAGLFFISVPDVQADSCTWTALTGNWNVPGNWSCNKVPGASDDVVIPSGTVTLTVDASAASLSFTNGTLTGPGNLTVGTLNWSRGTMSGSGTTTANIALNISDIYGMTLDTRTLVNAGTATWTKTANYISFFNSATFINQAGATFTITSSGITLFEGTSGIFDNAGTFTKSSSGSIISWVSFNNSGTVIVQNGTLGIYNDIPATSSGAYQVQSGAVLMFDGNSAHNLNGSISGSGTVQFNGIGRVNGVYNITGATTVTAGNTIFGPTATLTSLGSLLTISAGTLDMSSIPTVSVPILTQSAGILIGPPVLTVNTINWSGGTMSGSGATTASVAINFSGIEGMTLDTRILNNAGAATWTKTVNYLSFFKSATFNNQASGNFAIPSSGANLFEGSSGIFNNAGTFTKSSAGTLTSWVGFNNSGTVNVQNGNLDIYTDNPSTSSGAYQVQSGAVLEFDGNSAHNLNGSISGNGTVQFNGIGRVNGTYNLTSPGVTTVTNGNTIFSSTSTVTSLGNLLTISAGSLDLSTGKAVSVPTLTQTGGTLTGSDNLTADAITWSGGMMTGSGSTKASITLNISGTSSLNLNTRTLINAGTATWTKTGYLGFFNGATLNNLAGATFTIATSGSDVFSNAAGIVNNAGTLNLTTGRMTIATFNQAAGGITNLAIRGTTPITQYTQIISNYLNLAGALNISFNGYTPQIGDHFILLSYYNTRTGDYDTVTIPPLVGGFWILRYNNKNLNLWAMKYHLYVPFIMNSLH